MAYNTLKYEISNMIATITLNRPEHMNSYNNEMCAEINDALDKANKDDTVRVVIFTGNPNTKKPAFCAGFDLTGGKPFDFSEFDPHEVRDTGGTNALSLFKMRKPVIAAINGAAVGIGATMTLPMDIRIMSADAKLGFVFVRRGYVNEACSSWYLPKIVGLAKAMEWVLTGRLIAADEALASGLVNEVVPVDKVYTRAVEIAEMIRDNCSPVSVAVCRQMLLQMQASRHPMTAHKIESLNYYYLGIAPDSLEGAASFLEKRPPVFTMSPFTDMPPIYPWFQEPDFPKNIQEL